MSRPLFVGSYLQVMWRALCQSKERKFASNYNDNGIVNSKCAHSPPPPPLGICQEFVIFSVLAVGNLSENLCLGVGHLSILLEVIDIAPFSKYHLKFVYLGSYVYRYIENIFNTIICFQKRHVVFLHPSPSYLTVFFASV